MARAVWNLFLGDRSPPQADTEVPFPLRPAGDSWGEFHFLEDHCLNNLIAQGKDPGVFRISSSGSGRLQCSALEGANLPVGWEVVGVGGEAALRREFREKKKV